MPLAAMLIALTAAAVFVNGWTDAPNAIAGAVASGALGYRRAVSLAAGCNLAGTLVFGFLNSSVAETVTSLADFGGHSPHDALCALCAAMAAICLFATAAWAFGVPTSESHALVAALAGAALALGGADFGKAAWGKILAGLALSLLLGYLGGLLFRAALGRRLKALPGKALELLQKCAAGGVAFAHGAQDGQKFAAVFVLAGRAIAGEAAAPVALREYPLALLLTAAAMTLGTAVGGRRIVETVGAMTRPQKHEGFSADLGGGAALLLASLFGVPMSTSQVKTSALMGACGGKKKPAMFGGMIFTWFLTFPVCGALGYALTKLLA
jgi:PiT family inorganic phosphate transporter